MVTPCKPRDSNPWASRDVDLRAATELLAMQHIHYSVKTVLIATALLAAGFGALESDSALVASLTFSLHLGLLGVATVGACVARGNRRVFWIGFAVFGWVYSL